MKNTKSVLVGNVVLVGITTMENKSTGEHEEQKVLASFDTNKSLMPDSWSTTNT